MTKKVTLADVANSLGVSKTLVSLVVNDKGDEHSISAETQRKVREKIEELKYQPNEVARGFRTGRTNIIGLIVSDISNLFYTRIARIIEDLAWENGYTVIICSTEENVEKEIKQINLLRDKKIEGLVISTSQKDSSFFDKLCEQGISHVLIDRTFQDMKSPNVSVDNFGGGRLAARHLLVQGIKRAIVVGITPDCISTINDRINGFISAMKESGVEFQPDWVIRAPVQKIEEEIREKLQRFYHEGNLPEAIFALNNHITVSCMNQLRKLSIKVPEDVLLIGFDDALFFSVTNPPITTIDQPIERICHKAFDLLMKQIQKKEIPHHERSVFLPVDILIRESSVKPL
jgi:LacI family transcriptional regulator